MLFISRKRVSTLRTMEGGGRSMATIKDVAAYILEQRGTMSAMKLQKLCYFSYGYHLAWEERPLFPERFEAWANGPVSRALYVCHRRQFEVRLDDVPGNPQALGEDERESIDLVLEGLGECGASQLSAMTHREGPWVSARMRAGVGPMERSDEELRDEEIAEYFDALSAADSDGEEG